MGVVAGYFKILELVSEDGGGFALDDEIGQRTGFALELLPDAFNLVQHSQECPLTRHQHNIIVVA